MKKLLTHWQVRQRIVLLGLVVFSMTVLADNSSSCDGVDLPQRSDAPLFSARYGHQVVSFDDGSGEKLWVIGGVDSDGRRLNDIWASDDGLNWTQVKVREPYFSPRVFHNAVVFNNQFWVIGGTTSEPSYQNDVWSSSNGIDWTKHPIVDAAGHLAERFSPRVRHQVVVFNDGNGEKLWLFGGLGDDINAADTEIWSSVDGDIWTHAGTLPLGQSTHQVVVFDGGDGEALWLLGRERTREAIWNSRDGITWTRVRGELSDGDRLVHFPNIGHQAVIFDLKLWVVGGSDNDGDWVSTNGSDWDAIPRGADPNIIERLFHQAVVFNDQLFVIGGIEAEEPFNDIWKTIDGQTWTKLR